MQAVDGGMSLLAMAPRRRTPGANPSRVAPSLGVQRRCVPRLPRSRLPRRPPNRQRPVPSLLGNCKATSGGSDRGQLRLDIHDPPPAKTAMQGVRSRLHRRASSSLTPVALLDTAISLLFWRWRDVWSRDDRFPDRAFSCQGHPPPLGTSFSLFSLGDLVSLVFRLAYVPLVFVLVLTPVLLFYQLRCCLDPLVLRSPQFRSKSVAWTLVLI